MTEKIGDSGMQICEWLDGVDHPLAPSSREFGVKVADILIRAFEQSGYAPIPPGSSYLALGAGPAIAEQALAERIQISKLVLVDRDPSHATSFNTPIDGLQTEYVVKGIFEYLSSTNGDYQLISAIALEILLKQPGAMELFIYLIKNVVAEGGYVLVFPYCGEDYDEAWAAAGFGLAYRGEGPYRALVYCRTTAQTRFVPFPGLPELT